MNRTSPASSRSRISRSLPCASISPPTSSFSIATSHGARSTRAQPRAHTVSRSRATTSARSTSRDRSRLLHSRSPACMRATSRSNCVVLRHPQGPMQRLRISGAPRTQGTEAMRRAALSLVLAAWTASVLAAEVRSFEMDWKAKRYHIVSETYIDAPVDAVYDVLIDYDHYDRISNVFEESRYLERNPDGSGVVYTKAHGCIAFFCTTVERVERLEVVPDAEITAIVIPERSDAHYSRAQWRLQPESGGTLLRYELEMEPDFWVPPLIGPPLVKRALRQGGERAALRVESLARGTGPS